QRRHGRHRLHHRRQRLLQMSENAMKNSIAIALFALLTTVLASDLRAQSGPYQYNSVPPCRVVDTRGATSTNGGPALLGNTQRDFQIRGNCGVPSTAKAVTITVTVVSPTLPSWLAVWPSGQTRPGVSLINFDPS